ncbi:hypothetical protein SDC9_102977 [bioreactor metagenome]|uniref:Uncharacterized protein n=1 Tax=bioreactor metagenome TaxID=1076179 RepID=A0A645ASC4_9ZZZZ
MVFHCFGVGAAVVKDRPVVRYPGKAVAGGVQSVKIIQALVVHPLGGKRRLRLQMAFLHRGEVPVKHIGDQQKRRQKDRQNHNKNGTEDFFGHSFRTPMR